MPCHNATSKNSSLLAYHPSLSVVLAFRCSLFALIDGLFLLGILRHPRAVQGRRGGGDIEYEVGCLGMQGPLEDFLVTAAWKPLGPAMGPLGVFFGRGGAVSGLGAI